MTLSCTKTNCLCVKPKHLHFWVAPQWLVAVWRKRTALLFFKAPKTRTAGGLVYGQFKKKQLVRIYLFAGWEQQMVPQQQHLQLRVEESQQRPPAEDLSVAVNQRAGAVAEVL